MILGSHNTFTYLPPKSWWMYLGRWIYRCQNKPVKDQVKSGVRVLDVRVRFDDTLPSAGRIRLAHGLYVSRESFSEKEFIDFLLAAVLTTAATENFTIRLILETSKKDDYQEKKFGYLCEALEKSVPENVTLIGGNAKYDWHRVHKFKEYYELPQAVSSMASDARWYEKIWPAAYARRTGKKNRKLWETVPGPVLFDFI